MEFGKIAKKTGIGVGVFAVDSLFRGLILYWAWNQFIAGQLRSASNLAYWQAYGIAFALSILFNTKSIQTMDKQGNVVQKLNFDNFLVYVSALAILGLFSWGVMKGSKALGTTQGVPLAYLTSSRF